MIRVPIDNGTVRVLSDCKGLSPADVSCRACFVKNASILNISRFWLGDAMPRYAHLDGDWQVIIQEGSPGRCS